MIIAVHGASLSLSRYKQVAKKLQLNNIKCWCRILVVDNKIITRVYAIE